MFHVEHVAPTSQVIDMFHVKHQAVTRLHRLPNRVLFHVEHRKAPLSKRQKHETLRSEPGRLANLESSNDSRHPIGPEFPTIPGLRATPTN